MAREAPPLRLLRGDESDLFETYNSRLRTSVYRAVNVSEAIVDDACSYAWEELLRIQPRRDVIFRWLRTTAIREAWRLRDRTERDLLSHTPEDYHPGLSDKTITVTYAHELVDMIRSLPPHQARILMMIALGHRHRDISARLGISTRSVRKAVRRARDHIDHLHGAD